MGGPMMAEEHPGVHKLREGFKAFATANMQAINALFADDIVWEVAGANPLSGTYTGKVEMFGFFGNLIRETKGTWRNEVLDVLANDRHVVALLRVTATRDAATLDEEGVAIFYMKPDAKIGRAVFLFRNQKAVDAFLG